MKSGKSNLSVFSADKTDKDKARNANETNKKHETKNRLPT